MSKKSITLDELHELYNKLGQGEVVLDVRRPDEYQQGHIPGSININHEDVSQHLEELKKYKTIYVHCKRGGRAQTAYDVLASHGLTNIVCVTGAGMDTWIEQGWPVEK